MFKKYGAIKLIRQREDVQLGRQFEPGVAYAMGAEALGLPCVDCEQSFPLTTCLAHALSARPCPQVPSA